MFPFWDVAIAPILEAIEAQRVVEVGALRGETTIRMLDRLGAAAEVHVIDPVPEFDPTEHEKKFPGRYIFYRDLSLKVLPKLPPMDAALVDGDHNWYTVYHELKQLAATARAAGEPLPVLILHDVGWPYGRRDLYYAPEQIPEEFRQPHDQRGIGRHRSELLPPGRGGLNPTMHNAVVEGGPRNGVMTALDDFIAEHDAPLRRVVLPIYFGLAIVAEEERLARQPELAAVLDRLQSQEGREALLELAEELRIRAMVFQHGVFYGQEEQLERAANRYLDLLKGALLDEHYLENELRIDYLVRCLENRIQPEAPKLRDPIRYTSRAEVRQRLATRRIGRLGDRDGEPHDYFPYTTMGRVRLDALQRCLDTVRKESVEGDLVECGTGRGGGAIFMRGYLDAYEMRRPTVWVADRFRASPADDDATGAEPAGAGGGPGFPELLADLNTVRDGFDHFDLLDERVRFLQGAISDTLPTAPIQQKIAVLRLGDDLGEQSHDVLEALYKKVTVGGFVVVGDSRARQVVDEFRSRHGIDEPIERSGAAGFHWRKTKVTPAKAPKSPASATSRSSAHAPLAPPAPRDHKDLSVIVVFHNMKREAERTLHSLSRAYQLEVDDLDYEVIALDNGSDADQRLGAEFVAGFGPEFRYLDLGEEATPSPVHALNRGVSIAGGDAFAFMIDGAHVLTPGVLRFGVAGLSTYEPAIVATQQWYVGPGQQGDAMTNGYDQAYEDRLFHEIGWPTDGYRLFDIGHFIGDRDWFDGVWESNCMFVPRQLLEQVGAFDESFSMPGGGYANLELYERLSTSPDVTVVSIIGEGSFHQVHGGMTTNQTDADERRRRIASYGQHYAETRGRGFRGPGKPMHYVGNMRAGALRTKPRRRTAMNFLKTAARDPEGTPEKPVPIPEELKEAFTEAFWQNLGWRNLSWLGRRVAIPAADLFAYQELVATVRPDWIVETGTGDGGRAMFFASVCELTGQGRVLSIGQRDPEQLPEHPRITYLKGNPAGTATPPRIAEAVGSDARVLLVLGSHGNARRTLKEFTLYSPLVPVGSYVVVEDTIVNGHPVWPSFGPGPAEAVKQILNTRGDFAPDPDLERYGVTFNPSGFLKRLR